VRLEHEFDRHCAAHLVNACNAHEQIGSMHWLAPTAASSFQLSSIALWHLAYLSWHESGAIGILCTSVTRRLHKNSAAITPSSVTATADSTNGHDNSGMLPAAPAVILCMFAE